MPIRSFSLIAFEAKNKPPTNRNIEIHFITFSKTFGPPLMLAKAAQHSSIYKNAQYRSAPHPETGRVSAHRLDAEAGLNRTVTELRNGKYANTKTGSPPSIRRLRRGGKRATVQMSTDLRAAA